MALLTALTGPPMSPPYLLACLQRLLVSTVRVVPMVAGAVGDGVRTGVPGAVPTRRVFHGQA